MIFKHFSKYAFAILATATLTTFAQAADVKDCAGKPKDFLSPNLIKPCLAVAKRKGVTARERSVIYLQIAESTYFSTRNPNDATGKLFEAALMADNRFADAHVAKAFFRYMIGLPTDAIATLEAGLKILPDDPTLNAAYASLIATPQNVDVIDTSCTAAMAHPTADRRVFQMCAEALRSAGLEQKSLEAYRRAAFDFDQAEVIDYGLTRQVDIGEEYASLLLKAGRLSEAAEAYAAYLDKHSILKVQYQKVALLAYFQTKAGLQKTAADTYGQAARLAPAEERFDFRFKQLIALASTGQWQDAKAVSDDLFRKASKREILQLQVRLKTGAQPRVKITGKFDEITQSALAECLKDSGCFTKAEGDAL